MGLSTVLGVHNDSRPDTTTWSACKDEAFFRSPDCAWQKRLAGVVKKSYRTGQASRMVEAEVGTLGGVNRGDARR